MTRNGWIVLAMVTTAGLLWFVATLKLGGDAHATQASRDEGESFDDAPLEQRPPTQPEPTPTKPAPANAPVPAADPAAPSPAPRPEPPPPTSQLPPPERTGPVDELAARFASESRDASASASEKAIEAAFISTDVPSSLLHSVQCRRSVCRVETRWAPDRAIGFMSAFTRLLLVPPGSTAPRVFDSNLGIAPDGNVDASGARNVTVYVARLPPPEPEP